MWQVLAKRPRVHTYAILDFRGEDVYSRHGEMVLEAALAGAGRFFCGVH